MSGDLSESRRYPRVQETFPVRVCVEATGESLAGEAVNLSPFGIKIRCEPIHAPTIVRLTFGLPTGGSPLTFAAVAVRTDADGTAFAFINVARDDFHRLLHAVEGLILRRKLWFMVIEDEPEVSALLADFAEAQGYATVVFPTAEEALAYLRQDQPDGILLDLTLPGMSGLQFLDALSRQGLGIPVVVVSGIGEEATATATLRSGALDFIAKPLVLERLRLALGTLELTSVKRRLQQIDLLRGLSSQT